MFLIFSDNFNMLMSKIIYKKINKYYYFNLFWNEIHFQKQPIPHFQTPS